MSRHADFDSQWIVRPARLSDLSALHALAQQSLVGVTSLPDDKKRLEQRLRDSEASFSSDVDYPGEEDYLFVLEHSATGELLGCAGIQANCGFSQPFYSLRHDVFVHASPALGIKHKVHALSLCHDLGGNSLLKGFHVVAPLREGPAAQLISCARLLFIATQPRRFASRLVAEMVGCADEQGNSPFWDALGQHFFGMPYAQAEALGASGDRTYLAELLPHYPIYVSLLPEQAQGVMGQVHPGAKRPYDILLSEGFESERYIDVYDAGPTLEANTAHVRSVVDSQVVALRITREVVAWNAPAWLVSNQRLAGYRAMIIRSNWLAGRPLTITADQAAALQLNEGDSVRLVRL
ncbi:MAG TPA: arginine N-succinyltransferase [Pseudomonas sp.]|uniref:arginine N-succinyltransferase n=1 Tax=Pseudomonas sp. TaxID=306 RepID=UPI002ED7EC70